MAVTLDGVKFIHKKKKGTLGLVLLSILEFFFTIILVISLSANVWIIRRSEAVEGVSRLLSYQGRLTDASGNVLGGSGTNYCFRFSVYDATSGGSKLWPTTPTATVASVSNGVFNTAIGLVPTYGEEGGGDTLASFSFYSNETIFLNVEVGGTWSSASACTVASWESLVPRQRIDAVGYARVAEDVFSDLLYTDTTSGYVRVGSGVGRASGQKLLVLDVKNVSDTIGGACTVNGSVWYNSSNTRALVCENSTIQEVGNKGTIVGIKEQSAGSAITSGTVNFSAQANITISQDAQTLKFSVAALGGGGGFAIKDFALFDRAYMLAITNMTATGVTQRPIFVPFVLPGSLTWNRGDIEVSRASSGSNLFTADFGIYSYVNSTQISLMGSLQNTYSGTNTGSQSGIRRIIFTGMGIGATALTPGAYVMGMKFSASAGTASMNYSLRGATLGPPVGNIFPGANSYVTATSQLSSMPLARFLGRYTATSANLPNTVGFNQVQHWTSMYRVYFHLEST